MDSQRWTQEEHSAAMKEIVPLLTAKSSIGKGAQVLECAVELACQRNVLLKALKGILPHPIFGTTDPEKEREYWEYEHREGRGEALDVLAALTAIKKCEAL